MNADFWLVDGPKQPPPHYFLMGRILAPQQPPQLGIKQTERSRIAHDVGCGEYVKCAGMGSRQSQAEAEAVADVACDRQKFALKQID